MAKVQLENICKSFDKTVAVVKDLNLHIDEGEFVVLVGPSGCGKSTTLRMIAGLETITSGNILIDGQRVNDLPPKNRDIAMVFQNYALYGHMTVYNNIAFGLKLRRTPKDEIKHRVLEAAERVDLQEYLERKPNALSGGQRQRVALARAIVRNPKVFLFDEPLSNLDAKLRVQMRLEIARLQRNLGVTTIYVTHDQTEAMTMADRIALLKDGELQQFDSPMQLYNKPANKFVAGFIGSPSMNIIPGTVDQSGQFKDASGAFQFALDQVRQQKLRGRDVILGVRPEDIHMAPGDIATHYKPFNADILTVEQMGNESLLYVEAGKLELVSRVKVLHALDKTGNITLYIDAESLHYFDAISGVRL